MLGRLIAAVGSWEPPRGYRVVRLDAKEKVGRGDYELRVTIKKANDDWFTSLEYSATLLLNASQLRELLPAPAPEIQKRLTDLFYVIQRT